ncbi:uncharacterized protein PHACADRAFT_250381 [Phanerochaete carnosa HHB-10118-sp]|uniref:F-box domain-containing protein n=1 Tax=Phanerochaete carnosa (strain HHB-10118-sp) TaxID=650164 RepID=K5WKL9_PHACS|nr:uncharacterized protein PHACADRAFT_250381 [Phanerochaete carnosa HHB-10118-sp]EKM59709.1 hypothetical protein PHACADRAFT_250381 [Phanerochaete carnosa HHB-10118-sp]
MSLVSLPAELLEAIFEPLSTSTLVSLARTSADLYASASRLLYSRVSVSTYAHNLSAVRTLATRPHLLPLVRSFSISLVEGQDEVDETYFAMLYQAIRGMENLTDLEIHIDASLSWVLFDKARSPDLTHYPNLANFSCSFPLDVNVARFLEGTPSLHSLQVAASPDFVILAKTAIPFLSTYTGPACLLPQLLGSRPLTTLFLSGDLAPEDVESLAWTPNVPKVPGSPEPEHGTTRAAEMSRIETLSAITSAPPVAVIAALTKACPNLTSLRVITTCAFWETPDTTFYGQIANALASLRSLGAFELGGMQWEFRPKSVAPADMCHEKEWLSPPVSPRSADTDGAAAYDSDYDFENAFMEWGY